MSIATSSGNALAKLAAAMGILPSWRNIAGEEQTTGPATQRALLRAMGVPASSEAEIRESLGELRARREARRIPGEIVVSEGTNVRIPLGFVANWRLELESGGTLEGRGEEGIDLPLPAGLHRLSVAGETCLVIAAPERAPAVVGVTGRDRAWGFSAALYGLYSERNPGVGDYRDLADAARQLAQLGADFIGINPVHARSAAGGGFSPYSPSSRNALEPRHIASDEVPGAEHGATEADFAAWRKGAALEIERHALFETIAEDHGPDWRAWPEALRDVHGPDVQRFASENAGSVRRHARRQWLADRQLAEAQAAARSAGMAFGLYLDVAAGVCPGGADVWSAPDCYARGVSLGAPPDSFSPDGQSWDLAPFSPPGLRAADYRPFVRMLRFAMAHAGIVRIDHVLGLKRSFWVPESGAPGGYVGYPLESLLALVRIEAVRAACIVVGEDLGSVPAGLRGRLAETGLLGSAVMQFEKDAKGFRPPRTYRSASIAAAGTHDTPTLKGWWSGRDIGTRHSIGRLSTGERDAALAARAAERAALCRLLVEEGHAPPGLDPAEPPSEADAAILAAIHALLAGAGSSLLAVQLDDALGIAEQQNLPGTVDEHPNWRRRYPVAVEALARHPGLAAIADIVASARGGNSVGEEVSQCA